ncbi:alpha/beta fold hydrolase, partial [Nonomuraea sp. SBT364]|uniref:alpha/beta fold hydrolase n=1 Tax=Nonomuraea sp. SBT364 TaxID=1580530 RepID=UPI00066B32D3
MTPALLALSLLLPSGAHATPEPGLTWGPCADSGQLRCAELAVPVDWGEPGGGTITLTLARAAATGEAAGTVLFNPGGPGGAGVPALAAALANFAGLRERMDVVTWNPRGGQSGEHLPMAKCATGPAFATPDNRDEYQRALKANAAAIAACRDAAPELFANLDSATQARDLDAIRAALGEDRLTYLGNSYGGVLGASYARLFPERVRAMALDSVPDHTSTMARSERLQYEGLEKVFGRFAAWCAKSAGCALHGTDVERTWQRLVRRADHRPLPGARRYDGGDLKALALPLVQREAGWPALAAAIAKAADGDVSGFDPRGRGVPPQPTALLAVRCADGFRYDGYRAYRAAARRSVKISPNFAGVRENAHLACSPWAVVTNPPAPLLARAL